MNIKSTYYDWLSDDFYIDDDWLYSADDKILQMTSLDDLGDVVDFSGEHE